MKSSKRVVAKVRDKSRSRDSVGSLVSKDGRQFIVCVGENEIKNIESQGTIDLFSIIKCWLVSRACFHVLTYQHTGSWHG